MTKKRWKEDLTGWGGWAGGLSCFRRKQTLNLRRTGKYERRSGMKRNTEKDVGKRRDRCRQEGEQTTGDAG